MDDDDLREELVALMAARREEHIAEEEALTRHERVNDMLMGVLRHMLDRLDALEREQQESGSEANHTVRDAGTSREASE